MASDRMRRHHVIHMIGNLRRGDISAHSHSIGRRGESTVVLPAQMNDAFHGR
jgi:hypothetical protein